MNRYNVTVFLLLAALTLTGQEARSERFPLLNNHSNGQLVYYTNRLSAARKDSTKPLSIPLIFRGVDQENKMWLCEPLTVKKVSPYDPSTIVILPMSEKIDEWDLTTYALFNLSTLSGTRENWTQAEMVYSALMSWRGGARSQSIRKFLDMENRFVQEVAERLERIERTRNQNSRDNLQEKLAEMFTNTDAPVDALMELINDFLGKGDYYTSICLYSRFRTNLSQAMGVHAKRKFFSDVNLLLEKWDKALVDAYSEMRDKENTREENFMRIFPMESRGVWSQGEPVNFKQLQNRCRECFQGFLVTRNTSEVCEFPKWGNGMLALLCLFSEESADHYGQQFDNAINKYKINITPK